ncbi:protein SLOW WALKER 1 [Forsythia ovata]|uniref:Protein SLOW WALKER 1 n=1 Tax=Forsythia ovata TaxID=205694 RepID=A0ABD1X5G1_9LAMI
MKGYAMEFLKSPAGQMDWQPKSKYWKSFKIPKSLNRPHQFRRHPFRRSSHDFAATHSSNITIFFDKTLEPKSTIALAFADFATSVAFRRNEKLLAARDLTGT